MAEWKKIIFSGSAADLASLSLPSLTEDNIVIIGASGVLEDSGITFDGTILDVGASATASAGAFVGDGSQLTGLSSAPISSYQNAGDNKLITSVDSSTVRGEDNLTFDGSTLTVVGTVDATSFSGDGSQLTDLTLPAGTVSSSAQIDHDSTANYNANEHFLQSAITEVGTVTTGNVDAILPAGTVSSSAQIDHDSTNNFDPNEHFLQSAITEVGTVTTGDVSAILPAGTVSSSLQFNDLTSPFTGSFTGSFTGDGSGLTGVPSDLTFQGDTGGSLTVDLQSQTFSIAGTAGEIETSGAGQTLTIGLPSDVSITNDLSVGGNLTINGDLTYLNVANLAVEDQFILLNSGSAATGDSGFVFGGSTGTAGSGTALFWDASYNTNDGRLAIANEITDNATGNQTPDYYVAGAFIGTEANAATAQADHPGNIRVEGTDAYIYI